MKKMIIGMLLILPLIIVASVLFAIDVITVEAYIAVDRVELNHTVLELPLSDGGFDGLEATVYPTAAKNKNVAFAIENVIKTAEYEGDIATIDGDTGALNFFSYGTFTVSATTAEGNKKAFCNVYIKGDKPESVTLTAASTSLMTGESVPLNAVFYPVDAIIKNISWASSNESVARVDGNGIVTAISEGQTVISIESDGASSQITINVAKGVSKLGGIVYLSSPSIDLDTLFWGDAVTAVTGGTVTDNTFTFTEATASLTTARGTVQLTRCGGQDIMIEHAALLDGLTLRTGKLPLYLKARYLDSTKGYADVLWQSSDGNIAEIDASGIVTPKGKGFVRLTATAGEEGADIEINVVKPVSLIVLDKNANADKRGILEKTVYGSDRYNAGATVAATIDIGIVFPTDAAADEFIYQTDCPDLVRFIAPGRMELYGDFTGGKTFTVTVTAKISPYESVSVSRSHTFYIEDGINCYNIGEVRQAASEKKKIVLQSDIDFGEMGDAITLYDNLYGNGYVIDALRYKNKPNNFSLLKIMGNNVTVSNLTARSDDPANITEANGLKGTVIAIGERTMSEYLTGIKIEYCILENAYYAVFGHRAEYTLNGCIMRNFSNFAVFVESVKRPDGGYDYCEVTVNNIVISNVVAPAIAIAASNKTDKQSTFQMKGFADIYNWQQIDSMRMIDRDLIEGEDNKAVNDMLKGVLKDALRDEFAKDRYRDIRYEKDGVNYLHLGVITAGALYECTTVPDIEDMRISGRDLAVLHDGSNSLIALIKLKPVHLYCYEVDSNIRPGDNPNENAALYARLRGE